MTHITSAVIYTIAALVVVTLLDTIGAIASRVFKFRYTSLAVFSFAVYVLIGYLIAGISLALLAALVVGFYDGTVGWILCKRCKANFGVSDEVIEKMTSTSNLTVMLFIAPLFTFIGHLIAVW